MPVPGCSLSESDGSDVEEINADEDHREEAALKLRKKAAIPELEVDMLPSVIAPKMLFLDCQHCATLENIESENH